MVKILTTLILMSLSLAVVLGQTNMTDAQAAKLTDEEKGRITNPKIPFNPSELETIEKYLKWDEKRNKIQTEMKKQAKISNERKKHEKQHNPKIEFKRRPNQEEQLTVHIIPHSHDDVGWVKTVDEYYSGFEGKVSNARVKLILDSVVEQLQLKESRKFTYIEMKFFQMWYSRQPLEIKKQVKKLIKSGRLEITQGGWSSTDEACPNYEDLINNMYLGHAFLLKEFGVRPKVGWHVDPFGHSAANAALFSDFGFEAIFISRLDEGERQKRMDDQSMTFLWNPFSNNFGEEKQILGHIMYADYSSPKGFQWDQNNNNDGPVQNDTTLADFNADQRMASLINHVQQVSLAHKAKRNVMIPFGDDFTFQNARQSFEHVETIVELCNKYNTLNLKFIMSTPQTFVDALKKENVMWPVKKDDFYPYSVVRNNYWSGFFTSRPAFKKQVKVGSALLHAQSRVFARQVIHQKTTPGEVGSIIQANGQLLDQMGVVQHHDAVTGTAKQYVSNDYSFNLYKAEENSGSIYKKYLQDVVKKQYGIEIKSELLTCVGGVQNDTVKDCPIYEKKDAKEFIVVVHNPQVQQYQRLVRVLLPSANYTAQVMSAEGQFQDVTFDIIEQQHYMKDKSVFTNYELFLQVPIESDGICLVKIKATETSQLSQLQISQVEEENGSSLSIEGFSDEGYVTFKFKNKKDNLTQNFGVNLKKYLSHSHQEQAFNRHGLDKKFWTQSDYLNDDRNEGAYIFKPKWNDPLPKQYGKLDKEIIYQTGNLLEQWTILFNDQETGEQAIIKARYSKYFDDVVEFEVELNEIPIGNPEQGKDVTVNWKIFDDFKMNNTFYTDSNGLEMQERNIKNIKVGQSIVDLLPGPNFVTIAANYFPIDSAIAVRNQNDLQVTIMNDRAQGGAADLSEESTIELMQNRRVFEDDNLGVDEFLNETEADGFGIRSTANYYMQIFNHQKGLSKQRQFQIQIDQPLQYFFSFDYCGNETEPILPQSNSLTQLDQFNVGNNQITYKLFPLSKNQVLVRYENLADKFDQSSNGTQFVDLDNFSRNLYIDVNKKLPNNIKIEELSLTANQLMSTLNSNRFKWNSAGKQNLHQTTDSQLDKVKNTGIALGPQRIRQFRITYNQKKGVIKSKIKQRTADSL